MSSERRGVGNRSYSSALTIRNIFEFLAYPNGNPLWLEIRDNLKSGITVSLVSLPLSLALATASGTDPARGYQGAFWSGIFAAMCGGSHFNIVGPTGALSGVLLTAATTYTDDILPVLALGSAILCFVMWALRLVRFIMLIPNSVMEGFTLGVACIIAFGQLPSMLGLRGLHKHTEFIPNIWEALSHIHQTHFPTLIFFLINFSILFTLSIKFRKFPWSIIIAVVGILFGWLCDSGNISAFKLITLKDLYGDIPRRVAHPIKWSLIIDSDPVLLSSFSGGIAFITILETLISARIADQQTGTTHGQQREVLGIAIANFACAFSGSMPCTAALARTALNINSGATSRISALINSIMVLILSLALMPLFKYLPMPTIAALLVMVAYKMVSFHEVVRFWKYNRIGFVICILCAVLCLAVDTIIGLVVGALASLLIFAERMSHSFSDISIHTPNAPVEEVPLHTLVEKEKEHQREQKRLRMAGHTHEPETELEEKLMPTPTQLAPHADELQPEGHEETLLEKMNEDAELISPASLPDRAEWEDALLYQLAGQLNYVNAKAHSPHVRYLAETSTVSVICIHLRFLFYLDLDGVDALQEFIKVFKEAGKTVFITGATQGNVPRTLKQHPWFQEMAANGEVFTTYQEAMDWSKRPQANGSAKTV